MEMFKGDYDEVSRYVLDRLKARHIDVKEKARQVLIAKAIGTFIRYGGPCQTFRDVVEYELNLLSHRVDPTENKVQRAEHRIDIAHKSKIRYGEDLTKYLNSIMATPQTDENGIVFIKIPRSYDTPLVRARIKKILSGARID